jgi:hypothetical protein
MEAKTTIADWRDDITPQTATLKVLDGKKVSGVFKNNGIKKESVDYGNSIAFQFLVDTETENKTFYVKANNYDLLNQIKALGELVDLHVEISRTGSKKSDTRYKITKV